MKNGLFWLLLTFLLTKCVGVDEVEPVQSIDYVIKVTSTKNAVLVGSSVEIDAEIINSGDFLQLNYGEWNISDRSIASISNGIVTGISPGSVFVWVEHEGVTSDSIVINVVNSTNDLATIDVNIPSLRMIYNQTSQLQAVGYSLFGEVVPVENKIWSTGSENILCVSQLGLSSSKNISGQSTVQVSSGLVSSRAFNVMVLDAKDTVKVGGFVPPGGYSVSGKSSLFINKDAEIILRFGDDFQTQSGPGLYVYLSNTTNQVNLNGVSLGEIPKTKGRFEINVSEIIPNVELSTFSKVIVHCRPFDIPFGVAELD